MPRGDERPRGHALRRKIALIATLGTFVVFAMTTLVNEPKTAFALLVILVAAMLLDVNWKRVRGPGIRRSAPPVLDEQG